MTRSMSGDIQTLIQVFETTVANYPDNVALLCDGLTLSYHDLDQQVNQLVHYLISQGIKSCDTIGIFLERSKASYVTLLAVIKIGACYVPIDVDYPDDRVNYIFSDMPFNAILTNLTQYARLKLAFPKVFLIDDLANTIATHKKTQPQPNTLIKTDHRCYVIYTSGSTGKPKGVAITHANICHYIKVASIVYDMTATDRVYQGFSLAFDASLEELWMAFANGATLVACTSKDIRSGLGLIQYLQDHQVSIFSTVPTLLSTLDGLLPNLRLLILGGEACPASLIKRWSRPRLRILNTYGPTETTIVASYAHCFADQPVTIGKPLPGYEIVILDEQLQAVTDGIAGELCIGGLGLSPGYVNRPEMTTDKFIIHQDRRFYRSGDLALITNTGDIQFLGRIDTQVKLRGFRIELNEIETVIMTHSAISQAIVSLQDIDGYPKLVAYLKLNKTIDFNLQSFKDMLHQQLPHYMFPSFFECIEKFPLLASGKVNRNALPKPMTPLSNETYVAPLTDTEKKITAIWQLEFQQQAISTHADFFYELGGHSLLAAQIVSKLRTIVGMENMSILDLYSHPTIRKLAEKFATPNSRPPPERVPKDERNHTKKSKFILCSIGQFVGTLFQFALGAWQLLAVVLCYEWVTKNNPTPTNSFIILLVLFLGLPLLSIIIIICAKWLLLGRVRAGHYKLWGWFYLRWWLVQRLQKNIFSPEHLVGSPIINLYYRLLGANIGKNCYIGSSGIDTHDLLTIGDNSSIGYDARLNGYIVEDGWLKIGTIKIGSQCYIGARGLMSINTSMGDNSVLDDMSMLPSQHHIPGNQFYSGSPARSTVIPTNHVTQLNKTIDDSSLIKNIYYGILHYLALVFIMVLHYACYYPALLLLTFFNEQTHYLLTIFFAIPIGAIIFLLLHYLCIGLCKKVIMNKVTPGRYWLKSFYYLRQWTIVKMLDSDEVRILADSIYFPLFLRFLGANLGKHVEVGEATHILPDLITIHDEGFIASSVALGWPEIYQGCIRFAPVSVGKRSFLGNWSLLPLGEHLGDGGLLGCMSITPPDNKAADKNTSWLGSPAIFLPKREIILGFSDNEKFTPSKKLFKKRLIIEFIRIILPTTCALVELFSLLYVLEILLVESSLLTQSLILPLASIGITSTLVSLLIVLKWYLVGELKAGAKPIWNTFIWKNDIVVYLFEFYINTHFTKLVIGTPFISMVLRFLGTKIGKQVFLDSDLLTEFDLITIGDNACINTGAIIQTHLYEDRIFKTSTINIKENCNVGTASIILYDTTMEKNASLGNFSLLMKGERLPANTSWQGVPAQPMDTYYNYPCFIKSLVPNITELLVFEA